jgi:Flp pilus assembly secretin CpaC
LFKTENGNSSKTDLYIVVTPHVVKGSDGSAAILQKTLEQMTPASPPPRP